MSFTETVAHGALQLLSTLYPQTAPFVAAIEKWGPSVAPVIISALHEGGSALEAAQKAAPELTKSITELVKRVATAQSAAAKPLDVHAENMLRTVVGFPHLTHEQEMKWMQDKSPISEDSKSGSG